MFNANPLMRFDGYYMMADWLEIPNLRDRSNKYLSNLFQEKCLGIEVPPEQYMAPGRRVLFVVYAVTSYVYRWVITFSIIFFLSNFLGPQLKILSQMLAFVALASMFIWPGYRMVKNIRQRGRLPDMKAKRVYATAAVAAGLVAVFFFVPLPISRVLEQGLVTVDPGHAGPVGLIEPGYLKALHVREGQAVQQGQLLATFDSRELREQRAQAAARRDEQRRVADALRQAESVGDPAERERVRLESERARTDADAAARQVELIDERLAAVSALTAPRDGVVMGLPDRSEVGKMFDRNFQQARPVCTVGDPSKLIVRVPVTAVDYKLLKEDLPAGGELTASVYVAGRTDHLFTGKVRRLPESDAQQLPVQLTQRGGGPVAVKQSGEGGQEVTPVAQVYLVEVELEDPDATVRPGALVDVKIHCKWRTAAWWLKRTLSEALDIGLY
jgi:putative peptide zinc metalloprotease protein